MKRTILLATFVAYTMISPATALAQQPYDLCFPRDEALATLGAKYKEAPTALGFRDAAGSLYELLQSVRIDADGEEILGETWTLIETFPDKMSCLRAAGENWQPIKRAAPEGPSL